MATTKSLTVNLTVDKSSNRVLYAETDRDFVDVLLSLLSSLVSLTNKSSIPCLDNLYKSAEGLSEEYFRSSTARGLLLKPNHAAEFECLDLIVNVEGDRALIYYICSRKQCSHGLLSTYANIRCFCGSEMSRKVQVVRASGTKVRNEGVFLKGATRFAITDNLTVAPLSTQAALPCFAGTKSSSVVERQVNVGLSEIIAILHQSLISEAVLTNVFLVRQNDISLWKKNSAFAQLSRTKSSANPSQSAIGIKLIVDKRENKVLYAECKQDIIDILFSFLTYPSGFVVKTLKGKSHVTCFDNLYASVLSKPMADCFKPHPSKEQIVSPKLPSHLRLGKALINFDVVNPKSYFMCRTPDCDSNYLSLSSYAQCKCKRYTEKMMNIIDTRNDTYGWTNGIVSEATYIVTDDLFVTPLCSMSTLMRMIANAKEGVEEIPVNVGEKEVLALLEATLGSQSALTDAFLVKEETAS